MNRLEAAFKGAAALFGIDLRQVKRDLEDRCQQHGPRCGKLKEAGLSCALNDGHTGKCEPIAQATEVK